MTVAAAPGLGVAVTAIARVVVLEAVRGRLPWLMLVIVAAGLGLAAFTAQVAITESREIARGLLGAWLRVASVFVCALFVANSMVRDLNDKGVELVLALALPRGAYLAGRLAGYWGVALACALGCALAVAPFVAPMQAAVWGTTLALELLVVVTLCVLCLLTLESVTLGLSAVAAFYLLSRSMDAIRLIGANPLAGGDSVAQGVMAGVIDAIAFLLPELPRFARSEWLIHGGATLADAGSACVHAAIYLALLAGAALFDLQRKAL